jgi:uncharacterized protein YcbK (DUF882 family)
VKRSLLPIGPPHPTNELCLQPVCSSSLIRVSGPTASRKAHVASNTALPLAIILKLHTEALAELDHYLRDHRTGEVRHFDPHLFDLLYDLIASLNDAGGEIDVICGYRTPWSNEFLRTRSAHTAVALHSLHMQAEAIDIRLPGIPTSAVRDAALRLQRGGVGYYRDSNFIHVDVGRVRRW